LKKGLRIHFLSLDLAFQTSNGLIRHTPSLLATYPQLEKLQMLLVALDECITFLQMWEWLTIMLEGLFALMLLQIVSFQYHHLPPTIDSATTSIDNCYKIAIRIKQLFCPCKSESLLKPFTTSL